MDGAQCLGGCCGLSGSLRSEAAGCQPLSQAGGVHGGAMTPHVPLGPCRQDCDALPACPVTAGKAGFYPVSSLPTPLKSFSIIPSLASEAPDQHRWTPGHRALHLALQGSEERRQE